jgi:hypothetical protein
MALKTRHRRVRHGGKGGSHTRTSRLSLSTESKEAAEADTKGKAVAVQAEAAARLAEREAAFARRAALKAKNIAQVLDEWDDSASDDEQREKLIGILSEGVNRELPHAFSVIPYRNGSYKGGVKSKYSHVRHGFGEFETNKTRHQGEWKDNKEHGFGVFVVNPNHRRGLEGYRCEGEWKDGEMNGYGTCVFTSGDSYRGHNLNSEFDGYGVYSHVSTGGVSKCEYKNGIKDGFGTYESNNMSHSGLYSNDKFVRGRGTIQSPAGTYVGDLKGYATKTLKHGNGTYTYANGDVYEGQFKNDKQYGKGKLTMPDGTVQEGIWSGDKLTGEVTYPGAAGPVAVHGEFIRGVPLAPLQEDTLSGDNTEPDS